MAEGTVDSARSQPQVFISYRRDDTADQVGPLKAFLALEFGEPNVFLDIDTLPNLTGRYWDHIDRMLATCHVALVVIGSRWLTVLDEHGKRRLDNRDDVHRQEIEVALGRKDLEVIPVLVGGARMPAAPPIDDERRSRWASRLRRDRLQAGLPRELAPLSGYEAHPLRAERYGPDMRKLIDKIKRARQQHDEAARAAQKAEDQAAGQAADLRLISRARELAESGEFEKARAAAGAIETPTSQFAALEKIAKVAREKGAVAEKEATRKALLALVEYVEPGDLIADDAWAARAAEKLEAEEQ